MVTSVAGTQLVHIYIFKRLMNNNVNNPLVGYKICYKNDDNSYK